MFDTVAVAGLGLIGGSLGLALRRRGLARRVVGLARRPATLEEAAAVGAIDSGGLDPACAAGAELVVLAAPVLACPPILESMTGHLGPGTIVTDVGSTKAVLLRRLLPLVPEHADLAGGHPMAGSERSGVREARADLFEGAVYVLTPTPRTRPETMERLAAMARALGARPVEMEAEAHDRAVARISHLPHVVAAALAEAAAAGGPAGDEVLRLLVAGGFRSTTRIAAGSPEMWRDICLTNREAILEALDSFGSVLAAFRGALESGEPAAVEAAFRRGGEARSRLVPPDP